MIQIKQTRFADKGNCYQACLASLLELPLEQVPDFCNEFRSTWLMEVQIWLGGLYDLGLLHVAPADTQVIPPNTYHIITGMSDRGRMHSVIGKDRKMVFDPHPNGTGLIKVEVFEFLVRL